MAIEIAAIPLNKERPEDETVGELTYLGGLSLSSKDGRFGGISGLLWEEKCNRLLAVSDTGNWLVLEPEEGADRLIGIQKAWLAPILDTKGKAPQAKAHADAEAVGRDADGTIWVFYEQGHRGKKYPGLSACDTQTLTSLPDGSWNAPANAAWNRNGSLEAVAFLGPNLTVVTEQVPGKEGGRAGLWGKIGDVMASFSFMPSKGFDPTDISVVDPAGESGRFLVLQRRLSFPAGFAAVIAEAEVPHDGRRIVQGREIARLQAPFSVDNMEGLAVRAEGTRRFIYVISDDNFLGLQRTLLMKFEWKPK